MCIELSYNYLLQGSVQRYKNAKLCVAISVLIVIELLMVIRGGLLVARYANPGLLCTHESNNTNSKKEKFESTFKIIVTVFYYMILASLRIIEYLVLGISLIRFVSSMDINCHCCTTVKAALYIIPALILGIITVGFGIQMELAYTHGDTQCYKHWTESWIYIAYCISNIIRYVLAYSVRVIMLTATFRIQDKWVLSDDLKCHVPLSQETTPWEAARDVHNKLSVEYKNCGDVAQKIADIFGPWFIIPWIAFSFVTTINTHDVLMPWWQGSNQTASDWSKAYYLLYHITQLYLLISQYFCGLKMNEYHNNFYRCMRQKQLEAYDDSDYKAHARQMKIDYEIKYNFSPRILGIDIKTSMENPLYIFILLIGIFLGTSNTLYKK